MSTPRVTAVGPPVSVPTGPAGPGIVDIRAEGNMLRIELSTGKVSILRLPILEGVSGVDMTTVMTYVEEALATGDYAPRSEVAEQVATKAEAIHRHALADVDTLEERLAAIDGVLSGLGGDVVTSEDVAAAIAALQISEYLRIDAAAATYAPKAHQHTVAQITDFAAEVDKRIGSMTDLSTYAKTAYVDQRVTDLKLEDYLKRAEADLTYATKADVAGKWTAPTTGTIGDVVTWDGAKLTLQPLSSGSFLTKSTADQTYQPKLAAGSANGQVLTWNATTSKWEPAAPTPSIVTERFSMAGTLAVKTGASRVYNVSAAKTITGLHAAVGTAPAGSAVTAAIKVNGTQVGTVSIAAGAFTGTATLSAAWPVDGYVTCDVTAVGSTTPGADLVVTVKAV